MNEKSSAPDRGPTRRDVLRLLGLSAGAVAAAPILSACSTGSAASGTSAASGAASTGGGSKTITYSVQSFAHEALKPFIDEFKTKTGITVNLQSGPATDADLLTAVIPAFNSGTSPYDVMDVADPGCATLTSAGWLSPLDDAIDQTFWDDLTPGMADSMKTWNQKDGSTYRIYHNYELGYYWLRGDLLAANGLTTPTTWDEMVSVGKSLKAKTGAYAFADAAAKPGLMFVFMAYLTAQAGGTLYKFDDGTRQAFQFAHDLIYKHQLMPKDVVTWNYDQLNSAYMTDKLMSMREWTFFWDVSKGNKAWYKPEKTQIVAPPAGPAGSKTWAGGWGMAVPKASPNQDSAKQFVKYMSSPDVAARLAVASSFFVTARKSIFDKLGDQGIVKYLKEYSEAGYVTPRPYHPKASQAETIVDDIGQSYLTDQMDLDTAMSEGKRRIDALGS